MGIKYTERQKIAIREAYNIGVRQGWQRCCDAVAVQLRNPDVVGRVVPVQNAQYFGRGKNKMDKTKKISLSEAIEAIEQHRKETVKDKTGTFWSAYCLAHIHLEECLLLRFGFEGNGT